MKNLSIHCRGRPTDGFPGQRKFPSLEYSASKGSGPSCCQYYTGAAIIQEPPGSEDEEILKRAHDERLIILTFDRDYGRLIYRYQALPPAGVVYFRFTPATPLEPAEILINVTEKAGLALMGRFTIIERGRVRQRSLHVKRS